MKILNIVYFQRKSVNTVFRDSGPLLQRQMKSYLFGINGKRRPKPISSSAKIIKIVGFIAEILGWVVTGRGGNHPPPSVEVLQKMPPVDEG